jgi:hypothetical protein
VALVVNQSYDADAEIAKWLTATSAAPCRCNNRASSTKLLLGRRAAGSRSSLATIPPGSVSAGPPTTPKSRMLDAIGLTRRIARATVCVQMARSPRIEIQTLWVSSNYQIQK